MYSKIKTYKGELIRRGAQASPTKEIKQVTLETKGGSRIGLAGIPIRSFYKKAATNIHELGNRIVSKESSPVLTKKIKINIHKRVLIALDVLSIEDKNSVLQAISYPSIFGLDPFLRTQVKKIHPSEPLYLLRINPTIRVILRVTQRDEIEILDIVMKDRLKLFATNNT